MDIRNHGDYLLGETPTPCFLSDTVTDEIVYMNPVMQDMLAVLGAFDTFFGRKFYEVISNRGPCCPLAVSKEHWNEDQVVEHHVYNENLGKHFKVTHVLVHLCGQDYNLSKYFEIDMSTNVKLTFEEAMIRCISIFRQPQDTIIRDFMELLCEFYNCERAYVYHVDYENLTIGCDAQWCEAGSREAYEDLSEIMDPEELIAWFHKKNELGIVEANRLHQGFGLDSLTEKVLNSFKVDNITLNVIEDVDHRVVGFVGLSNRKEFAFHYRLIDAVTRFIAQDINNKSAMEVTLELVNSRDSLTGFHSRDMYIKYIEQMELSCPFSMGVVFVNVNGLKQINLDYGFVKGDSHIQKAAAIVQEQFGFDFYRISGDEFIGVAPDVELEPFEEMVNTHHENMKQVEEYSFSLGHAWGEGAFSFLKLVHEADTVMYINKQEYYHSTKRQSEEVENSILSDLLLFLEQEEFLVYLQPQVSLKDGAVIGAEALVRRYDKANEQMVYPDQFIPLYEKNSIVRHVDLFVLNKVCSILAEWGKNYQQIAISVNLSRVTLLEHGIVNTIVEICKKHKVHHKLLVLEVTERVGLIENEVASTLIEQFHAHGFRVSLDDFGCAYSNIVTLAKVSVNEVKIDKSIVDDLNSNVKNRIIAKNILTMCNELEDTETLAEGIESESQAAILREFGCTMGQGYLYAKPMPHEEFFEKYIKNREKIPVSK